MQEQIYDVPGLTERLDIGKTSAYRLVRRGEVRAARVGALWRITESAVMDFLRGRVGSAENKEEIKQAA